MKTENPNRIYLGKSSNYKKFNSRFLVRLQMIYSILKGSNCILIHNIREYVEDNERGRELSVLVSTVYDAESDWLSTVGSTVVTESIMNKLKNNGIGKEKEEI